MLFDVIRQGEENQQNLNRRQAVDNSKLMQGVDGSDTISSNIHSGNRKGLIAYYRSVDVPNHFVLCKYLHENVNGCTVLVGASSVVPPVITRELFGNPFPQLVTVGKILIGNCSWMMFRKKFEIKYFEGPARNGVSSPYHSKKE